MVPNKLMSLKYIPKEGEVSLSLSEAEIALIRYLKRYIWHLNITSASIRSSF